MSDSAVALAAVRRELVLTHTFDAPRELVFQAWTEPRHLARWWGPHGYNTTVLEVDLRPGGALRLELRGPDGVALPMTGTFDEVAPPERLGFTSVAFRDAAGAPQLTTRTTVTFAAAGTATVLTLRVEVLLATPAAAGPLAGMEPGWSQSLDKLERYLAGDEAAPPIGPSPALRQLDRLVGAWELSSPDDTGDTSGTPAKAAGAGVAGEVRCDWLEGGYFLEQQVDLTRDGRAMRGVQLIGFERPFADPYPSKDLTGRWFASDGSAYPSAWQIDGEAFTVWGGYAGSAAHCQLRFSPDGEAASGEWRWPGGGGGLRLTRLGITILRTFAAPRERVFAAWTDPRHFARWFGLHGSTILPDSVSMAARPGGAWQATMLAGPERSASHWHGVYLEVAAPARLALTLTDQPGDEAEVVSVRLIERDGGTLMSFHQRGGHLSRAGYAGARAGWQLFFDRLAELVQA